MSDYSASHDGFTPPDFLQKLISRNSSISTNAPYRSVLNNHNYSKYSQNYENINLPTSMPNLPISQGQQKHSPSRLMRIYSNNQQDKISTKKFRIFFKTIMRDNYGETKIMDLWQKFQSSFQNPFLFDEFIQDIRKQKQCQIIQKQQKQKINLNELIPKKNKKKSNSAEKTKNKDISSRSMPKKGIPQQERRKEIQKQSKYLKKIIAHGQNFIRNK